MPSLWWLRKHVKPNRRTDLYRCMGSIECLQSTMRTRTRKRVNIAKEVTILQRKQELEKFRWQTILKPLANKIKENIMKDRPHLDSVKAWEEAKSKARFMYKSNQIIIG